MSRNHFVVSLKGMYSWLIFGLDICAVVAAVVTNYIWLWALSVVMSLMILTRMKGRGTDTNAAGDD